MKIVPGASGFETPAAAAPTPVARVEAASAVAAPASTVASETFQSAVLQPAMNALSELPDIDEAKVTALREQLAKGELPFNASKLAALIESYHRDGGK
jgi:negative regulator of flagellin synthesis FlgM